MRAAFFVFFLTCCYIFSSAQNFSKAKIYTKSNTTIDCYIKNANYEGTPQKLSYSLTNGGNLSSITANEINKVEFEDGTIYENHFINVPVILENYIDRRLINYKVEANNFKGNALVEKIISGPVSFYQFIDKFTFPHFFYSTSSDPEIVLLPYVTY